MIPSRAALVLALAASFGGVKPLIAAPGDSTATLYALITPPAGLQVGCQPPCLCPLVSTPTYGSFTLVPAGSDPLYTYYTVDRFIASFNNGPGAVAITGSGTYRVGGEVALLQQLTLDLSIQGQPLEHFDSGLQPFRVPFPRIDISCAVHGFYCLDSVLVVVAAPVNPAGTGNPPAAAAGLLAVQPNPFRGRTTIEFTLARAATVDLAILDLAGRRVRTLAAGSFASAGPQGLAWDGLGDDGRTAAAGVYWVELRWPGGTDRRRFVKLD